MDDDLRKILKDRMDKEEKIYNESLAKYPNDVPNDVCYHAIIKGMPVTNNFSSIMGELRLLFETEFEKIYIWTYSKNNYSALVSEVDLKVKDSPFWKTAGSLIMLAKAYCENFAIADFDTKFEYKMMYYFDPKTNIDDIEFLDMDIFDYVQLSSGFTIETTRISSYLPLIELLNRDDRCYTAISLLFSSLQIHYCCFICELNISPIRYHESREPFLWEKSEFIAKMECAIVQACRCVESILGEPPNQDKKGRILIHKQKWLSLLGINPDDSFDKAGISYWEFYLKLFDELRNPSAHSYGNIHFDLERKRTVEAQCFALIVVSGYIKNNQLPLECAISKLKFNQTF